MMNKEFYVDFMHVTIYIQCIPFKIKKFIFFHEIERANT